MPPKSLLCRALAAFVLLGSHSAYAQSVLPDDYEEEEEEEAEEEEPEEEEEEEEEAEPEEEDSEEEEDDEEDPAPRVDARKSRRTRSAIPDRRPSSGLGFELSVGGLATLRRMRFSGTDDEIKHRPGPYFGGAIRASQNVYTWKGTMSHFLVEGEGGFGSAKNADVEPALGRRLVTEHAYLHVLGTFEKPIHPTVDLRLGLGIGASSFTVESNPEYTGHRYLSVVAAFGARHWLSDRTRIGLNVAFFPGIDTNQSADGYGAARSFGGRGEAEVGWRFFQPEEGDLFGSAEFNARYAFTRYRSAMPETQAVGDLAGTDDAQHSLALLLSYNL